MIYTYGLFLYWMYGAVLKGESCQQEKCDKAKRLHSPGEVLEFRLVLRGEDAVDGRESRLLRSELGVEPTGVGRVSVFELRAEGRRDPLVIHVFPIDVPEVWVCFDLCRVVRTRAKTLVGVAIEEL
jgi:hypothetical protein